MTCSHPRTFGLLCHACYGALSEPERHLYVICRGAAQANLDVVIVPTGVSPDRARAIAELCGARMGGVAPTQAGLFPAEVGSGTVAAL